MKNKIPPTMSGTSTSALKKPKLVSKSIWSRVAYLTVQKISIYI
jgi:hypothetical protein